MFVVQSQTYTLTPLAQYPAEQPVLAIFYNANTRQYLVAERITIEQQPGFLPIDTAWSFEHANAMARTMFKLYQQGDQHWREWREEVNVRG